MQKKVERLRRPRLRRVSDPPAMQLTARDQAIVESVWTHRFLRRDQIGRLFFPAGPGARSEFLLSSCNARLQRLFQHSYLSRSMRLDPEGSTQAVYALDRRGAALVAASRGLDHAALRWSPKRRRSERYFEEHTLAINDVWVALDLAARTDPDFAVTDWTMDGPLLWDRVEDPRATRGYLPVRPDAYLTLSLADRLAHFFLEVDRATMANRRFGAKIRAYQAYWRDGGFKRRYEAPSFRVLVTAPTPRRRDNLRRTALREGARGMILFAAHPDVTAARVLEPIWLRAGSDEPVALLP